LKAYVFPVCAGLAFLAFFHRVYLMRRSPKGGTSQMPLAVSFGALGIVFTFSTPPVSQAFAKLTGLDNISAFVIQVAVLAYCGGSRALVASWTMPRELVARKMRAYWIGLALGMPVMGVLFLNAGEAGRARNFLMQNAGRPTIAIYIVCYVTVLSASLLSIAHVCWKYRSDATSPWLRRGLSMVGVGTLVVMGYPLARLADVIGTWLGADPSKWEFIVPLCAGVGAVISLSGLMLPALGPNLCAIDDAVGAYRDYLRLRPLWSALHHDFPGAVPGPLRSGSGGAFALSNPDFLLYQRVVAIRDGLLAIRPWLAPNTVTTRATLARTGLAGTELDAAVAAAQLGAALDARRAGSPARTVDIQTEAGMQMHDGELVSETDWLVQVAQAFQQLGKHPIGKLTPVPAA
jgi:hypothetical protein